MKVFVSHSRTNKLLARRVLTAIKQAGLEVWDDEYDTYPSDNWAKLTGKALEQSDAMVALLTPDALESIIVQREVGFALGNIRFEYRLIPVLIGVDRNAAEKKFAWVINNLNPITIPVSDEQEEGINQITQALRALRAAA